MKIQLSHSFEDIVSLKNLLSAWDEFLIGKRNKKDVQEFSLRLMDNIVELHESLVNFTYRHGPYESFFVNDPKRRHIHKASVRDRLVHHAIYRVLYPFFERTFIGDSYSCRLDKGTHKAINRFRTLTYKVSKNHTRTCWVLKCDIRKFFASIDHKVLLDVLSEYIPDKDILLLLGEVVWSFHTAYRFVVLNEVKDLQSVGEDSSSPRQSAELARNDSCADSRFRGNDSIGIGLPLDNLTSQLFANVYMNVFDQFVKHKLKVKKYIRYADDFVIFSENKMWLENIISPIRYFLSDNLKLTLHPDKIFLQTVASGVDFLGWKHFIDHRILRGATKRRMFTRLKQNPQNETIQSYLGMLKWGNTEKIKDEMLNST